MPEVIGEADGRNWSTTRRDGDPTSVTAADATPAASFGQPVGAGAGAEPIFTVGLLVAVLEPLELLPITRIRSVLPVSALFTRYAAVVAPLMLWHVLPLPSHTSHWYWNVIGDAPLHVPGLAVSVLPAEASPLIVGAPVTAGTFGFGVEILAVALLNAPLEPSALLAITWTRTVLPGSAVLSV
jgi:hypothetical protein